MSRGFLIFAHNNEQIDYGLLALCNGLMIRSHFPDCGIALAADEGTVSWLKQSRGEELVNRAFTHVVNKHIDPNKSSQRRYLDTLSTIRELPWHNRTRASAYEVTPFEETILLDSDYLVTDDTLGHCWDSHVDLRMNCSATSLNFEPLHSNERRLEPFGIPMYWATCVYFRKSSFTEAFFGLVEHIRENYEYYQHIYRFPGTLYRNDYAFSIAAHILSGWQEGFVTPLPNPNVLTSFDCDELMDIPAKNELLFLVNDPIERWRFTYDRVAGMNVHVMNKFSIGRNADKIISLYGGQDGA